MSNSRELSKIFTADTTVTNHSELITAVSSASAHALSEAQNYTDIETSSLDLTATIITASAAAAGYTNTASASIMSAMNNLQTSDIEEHTNLYFTNQRAIDAGSATYLPLIGGTVVGGLTISGNLSVAGSTTYIDASNLNVTDSIINLSVEQQQEDVIDQGFTASYGQSGDTEQTHKHRGLVYDKSVGKWKLFSNVAASAITTTIDFDGSSSDTLVVGNVEGNLTGTSSSANYVPHTGVVGLSENYEPNIPYVSASPSTPTAGTLWIDSTASAAPALKVYNGSEWIAVSGAGGGGLKTHFLLMGA